jgi:predicted ester cyclase
MIDQIGAGYHGPLEPCFPDCNPLSSGLAAWISEERRAVAVTEVDLSRLYRDYIECLNARDWPRLGRFVHDDVSYNGRWIGSAGYREMLERDVRDIPDLAFRIEMLISDPPRIASRLRFNCTPRATAVLMESLGLCGVVAS